MQSDVYTFSHSINHLLQSRDCVHQKENKLLKRTLQFEVELKNEWVETELS